MSNPPPPPPPLPPSDASSAGLVNSPADFGLRLAAHSLDVSIFVVPFFPFAMIFAIVRRVHELDPYAGDGDIRVFYWGLFMTVGVAVLYWVGFEGVSGQTLGKKVMKIRVVRIGTQDSIGWWRALVRTTGKFIPGCLFLTGYLWLPAVFLIGFLWMLWDDDKQTWHDKMVNTQVVMVPRRPTLPPPDASSAGLVNQPADFGLRLVAFIIDLVVINIISTLLALVVGSFFPVLATLVEIVLLLWYWIELEGVSGQTLGKRAMKIRVVRKGTLEPIGRGAALGRTFGKSISGLAFSIGYLWMLWDDDKQTWHDKMVNSQVVMA